MVYEGFIYDRGLIQHGERMATWALRTCLLARQAGQRGGLCGVEGVPPPRAQIHERYIPHGVETSQAGGVVLWGWLTGVCSSRGCAAGKIDNYLETSRNSCRGRRWLSLARTPLVKDEGSQPHLTFNNPPQPTCYTIPSHDLPHISLLRARTSTPTLPIALSRRLPLYT